MAIAQADFPGARFYKADLHIHTPASRDWRGQRGQDAMRRIFDKIKKCGIEVVAITDHNSVGSLDEAKKLGTKVGVHVYPAVEISTKEGHVLALFDPGKPTKDIEE